MGASTVRGHESATNTEMLAQFEAGSEKARMELARKLHDELGGFLVAAVMDTAWAEQHLEATEEARLRLKRARKSLSAAVDLKRGIIEKLRPTLLDTFGLLAALRWLHKHSCNDASLRHTEELPAEEPAFSPPASIALFRVAQEMLTFAVRQPDAACVHLTLEIAADKVQLSIRHDGTDVPPAECNAPDLLSFWLIDNRVRALGGALRVSRGAPNGVELVASMPLAKLCNDKRAEEGQPPTRA